MFDLQSQTGGESSEKTITSPEKRWVIFREVFRIMSEMKWGMKPLEVNGEVHRFIMEYIKERDPFKEEKRRSNDMAMKLVEMFRPEILNSPILCIPPQNSPFRET